MEANATLRYLKMSPRKVRLVVDTIRGHRLEQALQTLMFLNKKAAKPVEVLLRSAAANAGNFEGMDTESLFVSKVTVDPGPTMKRMMPRAQGRANVILKRTCHVNIILKDRPEGVEQDAEAPVAEGVSEAKDTAKKSAREKQKKRKGAVKQAVRSKGVKKTKAPAKPIRKKPVRKPSV